MRQTTWPMFRPTLHFQTHKQKLLETFVNTYVSENLTVKRINIIQIILVFKNLVPTS